MFIDLQSLQEKVQNIIHNPLFIVLGEDRLAGIYYHRTPYVIKGCFVETHLPMEYERAKEKLAQTQMLQRVSPWAIETRMDVQEIGYFIERLKNSDLSAIEEVYSSLVLMNTEYHNDLKKLIKLLFTKKLYYKLIERVVDKRKIFENDEELLIPDILEVVRNYMMGIYLFRLGKFNPNINRLNDYFDNYLVKKMLKRLNHKNEVLYEGNSDELIDLVVEMEKELETSVKYTQLPENKESVGIVFDEFTKKMRELFH